MGSVDKSNSSNQQARVRAFMSRSNASFCLGVEKQLDSLDGKGW